MFYRLKQARLHVDPAKNTKYFKLEYEVMPKNPARTKVLIEGFGKYKEEGLSTIQYKLVDFLKYPLFTHILIDVGSEVSPLKTLLERCLFHNFYLFKKKCCTFFFHSE
jgi:hypothetical protein